MDSLFGFKIGYNFYNYDENVTLHLFILGLYNIWELDENDMLKTESHTI